MSSSRTSSCSNTSSKQRKHFGMERRPRMLKDFLTDDSYSCSSSGFKSFSRRIDQDRSVRNLIQIDLENARKSNSYSTSRVLQRSRSKAASATISAFQAFINSVKSIQFTAVNSPSILPRSLSRRLSKKSNNHAQNNKSSVDQTKTITTVKIKDIIRWKSFRDLIMEEEEEEKEEEKLQQVDNLPLPSSPDSHNHHHHCTSTATSSTGYSTNTSCSSSNGSSWCDSDFTSEYLPSWCENDLESCKKYSPTCVGKGSMDATTESQSPATSAVGSKDGLACEEKEQRSPLSVLDFDDQFEADDEDNSVSSFGRSLANVERTKQKLMQNIRRFESLAKIDPINLDKWMSMEESGGSGGDSDYNEETNEVEEKARLLLDHVKATTTSMTMNCKDSSSNIIVEQMLLDRFIEELSTKKRDQTRNNDGVVDSEMVRLAKSWINGGQRGAMDLEACVREMDREASRWSRFEEEQQEMGLQIENVLLNVLLDEVLGDLLLC